MLQGQRVVCFVYVHQCFTIPMIFKSVLTSYFPYDWLAPLCSLLG